MCFVDCEMCFSLWLIWNKARIREHQELLDKVLFFPYVKIDPKIVFYKGSTFLFPKIPIPLIEWIFTVQWLLLTVEQREFSTYLGCSLCKNRDLACLWSKLQKLCQNAKSLIFEKRKDAKLGCGHFQSVNTNN